MLRVLMMTAIAYAAIVLLLALFQRRLIYFPTTLTAEAATSAAHQKGLEPWRDSRGQVIGWILRARQASRGSVLVVHGNAGSATDRDYFAQPIRDAGAVDVYLLEYPGYGARAGSPSMDSFLAATEEAFDLIPGTTPRYIVGESLGTGAATHVARVRGTAVAGLALFMPYDDLAGVAQSAMPFLPAALILRDRFAPSAWLAEYRGPVKVVLAERDEVIALRFGRRLYDGYAGPKKLEIIAGARHNDAADQPAEWWKDVFRFWDVR